MLTTIDCWGTLLKASPTFSQEKYALVQEFFPRLTVTEIEDAFTFTKKVFNDVIVYTGGLQPTTEHIFTYLLNKLHGGYVRQNFIYEFIVRYQQLAMMNPPQLYSEETVKYLRQIKIITDMVISSNTMFISGDTLTFIFRKLGIHELFCGFNFSDKLEVAKPHRKMYSKSTFHIGDNNVTDYVGAKLAGSNPYLINSNKRTIKDAYNFIAQNVALRAPVLQ